MYSKKINYKIEKMFNDLRVEANELVSEMTSTSDTINRICQRVSSEMSSRSKTILSDMLFDLNDTLLENPYFTDISQQNKLLELNLRQEILNKYQFEANAIVNYQEASSIIQAIKVGSGTLAIGVVLKAALSGLIIVPIGVLIMAAFGAAMVNYLVLEPNKNKKNLLQAIDKYFSEAQQQLLSWFDEVEHYFNRRIYEVKQTF